MLQNANHHQSILAGQNFTVNILCRESRRVATMFFLTSWCIAMEHRTGRFWAEPLMHIHWLLEVWSWDSLLVRVPDSWSKGCKFESWLERQENFLIQSQLCVLTLIRCLFHPHVSTVACKRPGSFCQKCRWQVTPKHTYTLDPSMLEWADYAAIQAECGNLAGNELTRNSSGNTQSQSSQLAEPLWTDPGQKELN